MHRIVIMAPGLRALGTEVLNRDVIEDALSRSLRLLARGPFVPGASEMKGVCSEVSALSAISASSYWLSGGDCEPIVGNNWLST